MELSTKFLHKTVLIIKSARNVFKYSYFNIHSWATPAMEDQVAEEHEYLLIWLCTKHVIQVREDEKATLKKYFPESAAAYQEPMLLKVIEKEWKIANQLTRPDIFLNKNMFLRMQRGIKDHTTTRSGKKRMGRSQGTHLSVRLHTSGKKKTWNKMEFQKYDPSPYHHRHSCMRQVVLIIKFYMGMNF